MSARDIDMKPILLIVILGCCLAGCDALKAWSEQVGLQPAIDDRSVIFSTAQAASFAYAVSGVVDGKSADGFWMPGADDVALLEQGLETELRADPHHAGVAEVFRDYYRQYFGFTIERERYIYGAFFCTVDNFEDWRENLIFVADGGECFIDLIYDVGAGQFEWVYVHGEA
jgi:hypothetical protein